MCGTTDVKNVIWVDPDIANATALSVALRRNTTLSTTASTDSTSPTPHFTTDLYRRKYAEYVFEPDYCLTQSASNRRNIPYVICYKKICHLSESTFRYLIVAFDSMLSIMTQKNKALLKKHLSTRCPHLLYQCVEMLYQLELNVHSSIRSVFCNRTWVAKKMVIGAYGPSLHWKSPDKPSRSFTSFWIIKYSSFMSRLKLCTQPSQHYKILVFLFKDENRYKICNTFAVKN